MPKSPGEGSPVAGQLLFARYAYPPNMLGYCGSDDHQALLEYGSAGIVDGGLRELTAAFEGALPYLRMIASAGRITDPFAAPVVHSYWVGSALLDRVDPRTAASFLTEDFVGRAGSSRDVVMQALDQGGLPHHSFHVLCASPWARMLGRGGDDAVLRVLDRCRIRSGTILDTEDEAVVVESRPLRWDGRWLRLGEPSQERARWRSGGYGFLPRPRRGDLVSLHWEWICHRLSPTAASALHRYTALNISVANQLNEAKLPA